MLFWVSAFFVIEGNVLWDFDMNNSEIFYFFMACILTLSGVAVYSEKNGTISGDIWVLIPLYGDFSF